MSATSASKSSEIEGRHQRHMITQLQALRCVFYPLSRLFWFQNPGVTGEALTRHDVSRRKRGMFDKFIARDMDGDGDADFVGTRGNNYPYDGVCWPEQVRAEVPGVRCQVSGLCGGGGGMVGRWGWCIGEKLTKAEYH